MAEKAAPTNVELYTDAAYYTITARGKDKAGNLSEPLTSMIVRDNSDLSVGVPAVPATIEETPFLASAFLSDDLSIRDYYWTAQLPTISGLGAVSVRLATMPTPVDEFGADPTTHTNFPVNTMVHAVLAVQQVSDGGDVPEVFDANDVLRGVTLLARDQTDPDAADDVYQDGETTIINVVVEKGISIESPAGTDGTPDLALFGGSVLSELITACLMQKRRSALRALRMTPRVPRTAHLAQGAAPLWKRLPRVHRQHSITHSPAWISTIDRRVVVISG